MKALAGILGSLFAALALAVPYTSASAASCANVDFQDSVQGTSSTLVLNGLGIRKATLFKVKVYVAGLYVPAKSGDAGQILGAKAPWQLDLKFVHNVDAGDMRDAFHEGFEKTGDAVGPLQDRIDTLVKMFVDFKVGQTLTFTDDPAGTVAVGLDGKTLGKIDGADFSSALLKIWLGPEPPNDELKAGLLGGACE
jgi:hypothetical protein